MRLLISIFFPRSIRLEGVHTIIDSLATSFTRSGVDTTVLAPFGDRWEDQREEEYRCLDYLHGDKPNFLRLLYRYIQEMDSLIHKFDVIQLIDVAPSYLLLSERWSGKMNRVYDLIEGPLISAKSSNGFRFNTQYLNHLILKNRFWASLPQHRCRAYVVSTDYQRNQLLSLKIPPDRVKVIPYGIHPERMQITNREEARQSFGLTGRHVVGYLGHFSPMKGVPHLLTAFEHVASQDPDATLFLAWSGKGLESKKVLEMIDHMTCREQVKLVGKVNVSQFLAVCDVIVLPYVTDSIPHFPLVLTEAFASKVPVITTNVGGLSEVVKNYETGLLVESNNVHELANAISQVLRDNAVRTTIASNAYQVYRSTLNSDITASALLKLYQEGG